MERKLKGKMYLVSGHVYAVGTMSGVKAGINWPGDEEEKGETISYCGKRQSVTAAK